METYFDILPKEINEIILYKLSIRDLDNITYTFGIEALDDVINSYMFWNNHVRLWFPSDMFKYIPHHLWNFAGLDTISIIQNYHTLNYTYRLSVERMKLHGDVARYERKFPISNVTNVQFIIDIIKPYFDDAKELSELINDRNRPLIIEMFKNYRYNVIVEGRYFEGTYRQVLGLLLHLICNDHWERRDI